MTVLRAAAETHTGYVRSTNQDLALVSGDLIAVADGMGGHLGGEVASRTAIEELLNAFVQDRSDEGIVMAARRANRAVWRKSRVDRALHGMGTTLTAAALVRDGGDEHPHLVLVNVGDSRAYVLDRGTRELRQLTDDHSVVEEMVRQGELSPEEAAVHPHRHVLTRALGIEPEVAVDVWSLQVDATARFLLCSDGLTNELKDLEIAEILAGAPSPEEAVGELVGRALGHGGMDNVTVVVADVVQGTGDPAAVDVQLIPPGPSPPEAPVLGTPELTEAIPIMEPPSPRAGPIVPIRPRQLDGLSSGGELPDQAGAVLTRSRLRDTGNASGPDTRANSLAPLEPDSPGALGAPREPPGSAEHQARPVILIPPRRRPREKDHILTLRVALFVVVLVGLLAGTAGAVIWFDQSSYFVGMDGDAVAIYQGRPGGILWFKPQLLETSQVSASQLLSSTISTLRVGVPESSLKAAEDLVRRLRNERRNALAAAAPTTTVPGTTVPGTTVPGTTVPARRPSSSVAGAAAQSPAPSGPLYGEL